MDALVVSTVDEKGEGHPTAASADHLRACDGDNMSSSSSWWCGLPCSEVLPSSSVDGCESGTYNIVASLCDLCTQAKHVSSRVCDLVSVRSSPSVLADTRTGGDKTTIITLHSMVGKSHTAIVG